MTALTKDSNGNLVQKAFRPGATQNISTATGTAAQSTAIGTGTKVTRVVVSTDTYCAVGANPTATVSSVHLVAGVPEWIITKPGEKMSFLAVSAAGVASMTELA